MYDCRPSLWRITASLCASLHFLRFVVFAAKLASFWFLANRVLSVDFGVLPQGRKSMGAWVCRADHGSVPAFDLRSWKRLASARGIQDKRLRRHSAPGRPSQSGATRRSRSNGLQDEGQGWSTES